MLKAKEAHSKTKKFEQDQLHGGNTESGPIQRTASEVQSVMIKTQKLSARGKASDQGQLSSRHMSMIQIAPLHPDGSGNLVVDSARKNSKRHLDKLQTEG